MSELLNLKTRPASQFGGSLDGGHLRAECRRLIAQRAALRRLAGLVAGGVGPCEVFGAVADEMCRYAGGECAGLYRYESSGEITLMAGAYHAAASPVQWPVGTRTPIAGNTLASTVLATGRPARMDSYENVAGALAAQVRAIGVRAAVGVPVIVDGRVWGLATVGTHRPGPMPADAEVRITCFAELAATAVVAGYRDEQKQQLLAEASQRLHRAADGERRRIERDLHDGAQQHLVTLALHALEAEACAPAELGELKNQLSRLVSGLAEVSLELQEISRGIPPAILTKGGLGAALAQLARRSPVPVQLDVNLTATLPQPLQIAAYYLVAEALTNTAKHAHAHTIEVHLHTDHTDTGTGQSGDPVLRVWVTDDGRGGANPHGGSGLDGLNDRIHALGGRLWLHSPPEAGTTIRAELPLTQPSAPPGRFG
ncbi:histidine kinase,GAF domain-containing protein [Mycobacterium sp. JS623]|uniref:GAF domain-containing sensor histidine kinase n=1 Tax=Mycobacterium sp. JS623 TaxID=212767 RepID=UPI0002A55046|nr:GAF domain-containing protein [Mycobacterium sp. JS623]AGB24599.1 histidine kinase,GAF domain-containing protein [Mycobacterium sp. JS623]